MKNFVALFGGVDFDVFVGGKKTSARRKIHTKKHNFFSYFSSLSIFHPMLKTLDWLHFRHDFALEERQHFSIVRYLFLDYHILVIVTECLEEEPEWRRMNKEKIEI